MSIIPTISMARYNVYLPSNSFAVRGGYHSRGDFEHLSFLGKVAIDVRRLLVISGCSCHSGFLRYSRPIRYSLWNGICKLNTGYFVRNIRQNRQRFLSYQVLWLRYGNGIQAN
jgi:hypothetical protein